MNGEIANPGDRFLGQGGLIIVDIISARGNRNVVGTKAG